MPVCVACGTQNPDVARFCLACGQPIAAAPPPEEERKPVTAVFIDLVGSTSRGEQLDPEDVLGLLEPYYARLRAELERHGGTVEKFIGDAVVAVFGAPAAHEDDPERAVRAGLAVLDAISALNEEDPSRRLSVRVGVATGEAIVSLAARSGEGRGIAWGDVLNTAARLQSAAPENGVLVGAETYRASATAVEYLEREPVVAKGKAEPVPVWQALGLRREQERRGGQGPLVGRDAELERILASWQRTLDERRPRLVTLVGPAGIGKSRLLAEAATRAAERGAVHWGRCLSYGEGIAYWPVTEIVKERAGILPGESAEQVAARLGDLLEELPTGDPGELRTIATALATLVGAVRTPRGTYSAETISQAELHWGIRRLFELLARLSPLVLVLEDLHWAEPTLLELIAHVLAGEEDAPLLVLASARPELADVRPSFVRDGERRTAVELAALGATESEALLAELLPAAGGLDRATRETLLRRAAGNPLFLEEIVRMLAETGTDDGGGLPVPRSLQALIGSRLDGLPPQEKRVAQHASVAGTVFWAGAVGHLLEADGSVDAELKALARRDVVRPQEASTVAREREWAFKHVLIRDVAYGRLPKGRRALLHVRFADWMTALPTGEDEFVELVAYHLEQSCRLAAEVDRTPMEPPVAAAVAALTRAGEKAERQEGIAVAERFYARALALVGPDAPARLELRLRRGRTQMVLGELRAAQEELTAVAEEAAVAGRPEVRCPALITLANVAGKQGRAGDALGLLEEASELAERLADYRLRIAAAYETARQVAWFRGDHDAAVRSLELGIALAEEIDDRSLRSEGHLRLGTEHVNVGRLVEAERQFELSRALAGAAGSYRDEARASFGLGFVRFYRGDPAETEELVTRTLAWLERVGDRFLQLQSFRLLARLAERRGDLGAAERCLQQAVPLALETGGWLVAETYRYLVEVLLRQGRLADARALAALLRRELATEDVYARSAAEVADGMVAAASGDGAAACASFESALALLAKLRHTVDLAEARVCYARCLHALGLESEAEEQYERAREAFAGLGATNPVAEIEREVGETAGGRIAPAPRAP